VNCKPCILRFPCLAFLLWQNYCNIRVLSETRSLIWFSAHRSMTPNIGRQRWTSLVMPKEEFLLKSTEVV